MTSLTNRLNFSMRPTHLDHLIIRRWSPLRLEGKSFTIPEDQLHFSFSIILTFPKEWQCAYHGLKACTPTPGFGCIRQTGYFLYRKCVDICTDGNSMVDDKPWIVARTRGLQCDFHKNFKIIIICRFVFLFLLPVQPTSRMRIGFRRITNDFIAKFSLFRPWLYLNQMSLHLHGFVYNNILQINAIIMPWKTFLYVSVGSPTGLSYGSSQNISCLMLEHGRVTKESEWTCQSINQRVEKGVRSVNEAWSNTHFEKSTADKMEKLPQIGRKEGHLADGELRNQDDLDVGSLKDAQRRTLHCWMDFGWIDLYKQSDFVFYYRPKDQSAGQPARLLPKQWLRNFSFLHGNRM